jgi:plasmid stabilization system protein ParE
VNLKPVRIRSEAQEEIASAFEWYLQRNARAAEAFLNEVDASLELIASHPQLYPSYTKNTIVAVAHAKRRSGCWSKQLKQ